MIELTEKTNKDLRQLNLIAYLLNHRFPVTWEEIRQKVPGYQPVGGVDEKSILRKFERDKEELREQGVPIDTVPIDSEVLMGYRLDRSRFYLPRFAFTDEEIRALVIAVRRLAEMKGFSMAREARSVLRKLVFDSPCGAEADGSLAFYYSGHYSSPELETVAEALMYKKRLQMTYYSLHSDSVSDREVHPYALLQRRGGWYLVAWCCLRKELRQFRLERIRSIHMNRKDLDTPDYTIPKDFSLKDYMGQETWDYSVARPTSVEVKMSRARYQQARARWSDRDDVTFPSKRRNVVVMKVRDDAAFCRWVLAQQGRVEILSPRRMRREMRSLIRRMIDLHVTGEEGTA
jgi:predicted DNA-binding transcriptional regulator YafY